jgi:HK97 gp10 family phage protein
VSAVVVKGLDALQRRLAAAARSQPLKAALRAEAEAIAADARNAAPGELGQTVEVIDDSRETRLTYAIGTSDPAGRFLEFGTARRPATPWLWPVFRARSPAVKHKLRELIGAAFQSPRGKV